MIPNGMLARIRGSQLVGVEAGGYRADAKRASRHTSSVQCRRGLQRSGHSIRWQNQRHCAQQHKDELMDDMCACRNIDPLKTHQHGLGRPARYT